MSETQEPKGPVERQVRPGVTVGLEPLDECCFRLSIKRRGEEIQSGVWCPKSHRVVIDGDVVGFASTPEGVLKGLRTYKVERWGMA